MQSVVRSFVVTVLALGCVVVVSTSWALVSAIPVLAAHTTALIMGGTWHPLIGPKDEPDFVTAYLDNAVVHHLDPAFIGPVTNAVAVFTPEELFPIGRRTLDNSVADGLINLQRCLMAGPDCVFNDDEAVVPGVGPSVAPQAGDALMVFGFSQSAMIASLAKQGLIDDYLAGAPALPFLLVANPMRPNGGVLMRGQGWPTIPILGISFIGASPTDSAVLPDGSYVYPTVDIATQYDGLGGDFPVRPLNLLALANAVLGYHLLHGESVDTPLDQARYQGREGDTSYYLIETDIVPILQPLARLIPQPILKALDAPLRVLIEDAYERDIGPGTPTPFSWWPTDDLLGLAGNLIRSLPVAVDNLLEGFGLSRMLGTQAPGTYGVGGPDLPDEPSRVSEVVAEVRRDAAAPDPGFAPDPGKAEPVEPVADTAEGAYPGSEHAHTEGAGGKPAEAPGVAEAPDVVEATDSVADAPDVPDVRDTTVDVPDPVLSDPVLLDAPELTGVGAEGLDSEDSVRPEPDSGPEASQPDTDAAESAGDGASESERADAAAA